MAPLEFRGGGAMGPRGLGSGRPLHFGQRKRRWPWSLLALVVVGAAGGAVVLVRRHVPSAPTAATSVTQNGAATHAPAVRLVSITPAPGTAAVPLDAGVTVAARSGRLDAVTVSGGATGPLVGTLDPTRTTWTSTQALAASTTYVVRATVTRPGHGTSTETARFTTLTPTAWVGMTIWPDSGLSVGVGQPIVLKLSHPVTDAAARQVLLSRLHVAASTPVPLGAYWFSDSELHLRPQSVWPSGERISFSDSLDGWNAGGGDWGRGSGSVAFSVGDARISTADLSAHKMTVTDNGKVVAVYPISAGSTTYPTMNGVHIVMDRRSQVQMVSSTVGIPVNSPGGYDETVYWDVHISDSGEYVHAAPWSLSAQGYENVSHGCINLSPDNAQQFFGFSRVGDIVYVVGGPRQPVSGDHGVMDWLTPWSSFTPVPVGPLA